MKYRAELLRDNYIFDAENFKSIRKIEKWAQHRGGLTYRCRITKIETGKIIKEYKPAKRFEIINFSDLIGE